MPTRSSIAPAIAAALRRPSAPHSSRLLRGRVLRQHPGLLEPPPEGVLLDPGSLGHRPPAPAPVRERPFRLQSFVSGLFAGPPAVPPGGLGSADACHDALSDRVPLERGARPSGGPPPAPRSCPGRRARPAVGRAAVGHRHLLMRALRSLRPSLADSLAGRGEVQLRGGIRLTIDQAFSLPSPSIGISWRPATASGSSSSSPSATHPSTERTCRPSPPSWTGPSGIPGTWTTVRATCGSGRHRLRRTWPP